MLAAVRSIAAKMSGNCFWTRAIRALVSLLGRCPVIPTRIVRRGLGGCRVGDAEESDDIVPPQQQAWRLRLRPLPLRERAALEVQQVRWGEGDSRPLTQSVVLNHRVALSRKGRGRINERRTVAPHLGLAFWAGRCGRSPPT